MNHNLMFILVNLCSTLNLYKCQFGTAKTAKSTADTIHWGKNPTEPSSLIKPNFQEGSMSLKPG